jgi:hypothetical protein
MGAAPDYQQAKIFERCLKRSGAVDPNQTLMFRAQGDLNSPMTVISPSNVFSR